MSIVELSKDTFASTVDDNGVVLIDFWASWCGPCMRFAPVYDEVAAENEDVVFAKVDTEEHRDLSAALEIQAIPTLMAFKDGALVFRQSGALNATQLRSLVEQVKGFDVEAAKKAAGQQG